MKIIVFGGTGFIGKALLNTPLFRESEVHVVTRHPHQTKIDRQQGVHLVPADDQLEKRLLDLYSGHYGIVNLAGHPLSRWPWTKKQRQKILNSRVRITQLVSDTVNTASKKPEFIAQGSAIGYYGFAHKGVLSESNAAGSSFLAKVCKIWEDALQLDEPQKTRVIYLRTGLVIGKGGGLLSILKLPFRFFVGGPLGSGKQMVSWIHLDDEAGAIEFLIKNEKLHGPFNLTAPNPVGMGHLLKSIGKHMHRPYWLPVPAFLLKTFLGSSFAQELVLGSQEVVPQKLHDTGYKFKFSELEKALSDLI